MTTESNTEIERPMLDLADVRIPEPGTPLARALCALLRCRRVSSQVFEALFADWALDQYVGDLRTLGWPIVQDGDCYTLDAELADRLNWLIEDCSEFELQYAIGLIAGEAAVSRSEYALH